MGTKEVSKTLRRNRVNKYLKSSETNTTLVFLKRNVKTNKTKLKLQKYDKKLRKRVEFVECSIPKEKKKR